MNKANSTNTEIHLVDMPWNGTIELSWIIVTAYPLNYVNQYFMRLHASELGRIMTIDMFL